jgi:hypothetical protein
MSEKTYDIPGSQCPLCKAVRGHFMGCSLAKPPLSSRPKVKFDKETLQQWFDEYPEVVEQFKKSDKP